MESIKTKGLIIKSTNYGEANRMLKVFTVDMGIVSVCVYGARGRKKGLGASSRIFGWGDFMLGGTQERLRAEEISIHEGFYPLAEDIAKLSAAVYFADLAEAVTGMSNPDAAVLRLLLNTLYAMCYKDVGIKTARAVYELRIAAAGGYMPVLDACVSCGETEGEMWFDILRGGRLCRHCRRPDSIALNAGVAEAMRYILTAEEKRIFSFYADDGVINNLLNISEKYAAAHFERDFASLDYLKKLDG